MRVSYGKLISRARMEAGITQQELADEIEVKRETVSRWERDMLKVTPSAEEMHRLVARLPVLSEVQLLESLGYNLGVMARILADSLSPQEDQLVESYRVLSPALRRVILRQVQASHLPDQDQGPPPDEAADRHAE